MGVLFFIREFSENQKCSKILAYKNSLAYNVHPRHCIDASCDRQNGCFPFYRLLSEKLLNEENL